MSGWEDPHAPSTECPGCRELFGLDVDAWVDDGEAWLCEEEGSGSVLGAFRSWAAGRLFVHDVLRVPDAVRAAAGTFRLGGGKRRH